MATQVRRRRGTTAENLVFTGAEGEFSYDSELKTIRVHDGSTAGGFPLLKQSVTLTAGTKCKITYNEQGLVTAGADLSMEDLPADLATTYLAKNDPITPTSEGSWKCKVQYDADGLILDGSDLEASDIPSGISQSKIENLESDLAEKMPQIRIVTPSASSGSIQLTDNAVNKVVLTGSATLVSPNVAAGESGIFHQCLVQLYKPDIGYTVTFSANKYFGSTVAPDISSVGYYNIYYEYDSTQNAWVIGAIQKKNAA